MCCQCWGLQSDAFLESQLATTSEKFLCTKIGNAIKVHIELLGSYAAVARESCVDIKEQ